MDDPYPPNRLSQERTRCDKSALTMQPIKTRPKLRALLPLLAGWLGKAAVTLARPLSNPPPKLGESRRKGMRNEKSLYGPVRYANN